ncbi:MAG TPA: hypothetical protein VF576_14025, partial [Rubricoccaceae bacterium]
MRRLTALALALSFAGPAAAQWVPTGGPPGGSFSSLAAPDGALVAADFYTAMRFTGGGWESAAEGLGDLVADGPRVLARTGDGLALSTDAGATFSPLSAPWERHPLSIDGATLFAINVGSIDDSLRVSTDDGATWGAVRDEIWVTSNWGAGSASFSAPVSGMVGALADGDAVIVAGTAYVFGGVYRHAPGDTAWVPLIQPGAPFNASSVIPYSLVRHDGALWFSHSDGVHRSLDGGTTWTDVSAGLPASSGGFELYAGAVGLVARVRGSGALARWTGTGWTAVPPPPTTAFALTSGDALYVSSLDHVYAFDGTAWSTLPDVVASSPRPIASDPAGALVVASNQRLLRSTAGAASWTSVLTGATGPYAVTPGRIVAWTVSGLRRSVDGGVTWTAAAQPPVPAGAMTRNPNALVAHGDALFSLHGYTRSGKHGVLLERYGAAFRSPDGGATWTEVSAGIPESSVGPWPISAGVSFPDGVFAVTGGGCVRLADGASSWAPTACPAGQIRDVAEVGEARVVLT